MRPAERSIARTRSISPLRREAERDAAAAGAHVRDPARRSPGQQPLDQTFGLGPRNQRPTVARSSSRRNPAQPVTYASGSPSARRSTRGKDTQSTHRAGDGPGPLERDARPGWPPSRSAQIRSASRAGRRRRRPRSSLDPRLGEQRRKRNGDVRHRSAPAGSPCAAHRPGRRDGRSARRRGCAPTG